MIGPPMVTPNWLRCSVGFWNAAAAEDEADGVQVGIAQELVRRAVKLVGAGPQRRVDHAAAHAPVLRAEVAGDDLELGERVRRGLHHLARIILVAGAVGVVVQPSSRKLL